MTEKLIISDDQDYREVEAELNACKKPSKTLRFLMQALENYRQSKKMGWSRPWNKENVVNFQSFKLNASDQALCRLTLKAIEAEADSMPSMVRQFISELLNDGQPPMGYVFFQEFTEQESHYEGAVISYGRISKQSKRHRDRLDVILESAVTDGCSQGLSRMRIYVDPYYAEDKQPLWQGVITPPVHADTLRLFEHLAGLSWAWEGDINRTWNHWIIDYIDYFGPRQWPMRKSFFHVSANPDSRIALHSRTDSLNDMKVA
ncbi:MAG: hypothetical protein ACXWE4_04325 [Methylobacter sp.]